MSDRAQVRCAMPAEILASGDGRLVDLVDGLLDHGVWLRGEILLSVADIDLVFVGVDLVLANHDKLTRGRGT